LFLEDRLNTEKSVNDETEHSTGNNVADQTLDSTKEGPTLSNFQDVGTNDAIAHVGFINNNNLMEVDGLQQTLE